MNFKLINDTIKLLETFDSENINSIYSNDINGFKNWIAEKEISEKHIVPEEPAWEGKNNGRSAESVISTLLVHLNRYAKTYSKSAIAGSDFSTQEEFIYLINLQAFGEMTKIELIKKNIHDKSAGILTINRLIKQGWVEQTNSAKDKRSKVLKMTQQGIIALDQQMNKIRNASKIVTGNLNYTEKIQLIKILDKLDRFHNPIYNRNIDSNQLIETVLKDYSFGEN
ncbi:MarR family winged helix-turn-helix transcriptional regulator [Epilithonimonas mollis]|nr:MarR family transcriptional regulator [Epilithonimonas mollis]